jgi:hypothetical protein
VQIPAKLRVTLCLAVVLLAAEFVAFRNGHAQSQQAFAAESTRLEAAPRPKLKPAPPTPIAEQKAELGDDQTWRPEWDAIVEKSLTPELLSSRVAHDVHMFCPRFNAMGEADRRAYWAYFFQALSGAEAGLLATSSVRHTEPEVAVEDGVSHRMVRSEGLLQLTYEDSQRYGCDFDWDNDKGLPEHDPAKTILQPKNNLECGVKVLQSQLIDHKKPLLSKTSYWSTLRPGWPGFRVFLQQMSNVPSACGPKRASIKPPHTPGPSVPVDASH